MPQMNYCGLHKMLQKRLDRLRLASSNRNRKLEISTAPTNAK